MAPIRAQVKPGERHTPSRANTFVGVSESPIIVEHRKELTYLLCQGAELEHGLMCQYLYAAFSLKNTAAPGRRRRLGDDRLRGRPAASARRAAGLAHAAARRHVRPALGCLPGRRRPPL